MAPNDPGLDGRPAGPSDDLGGLGPSGQPEDISGIGKATLGGEPGAAEADQALRDIQSPIQKKSYPGEGLKVDGAKMADLAGDEWDAANIKV